MKKLAELYTEHRGKISDKWEIYLKEYERLFSDYRENNIQLLEVGIQNGGSLEIWSKYFPFAKNIIGCDLNSACSSLSFNDNRISVFIGDINADDIKARIHNISCSFDIIIDDGSHISSDIIKTFCHYFSNLKPGGTYIAEDLHCSYWHEYEGGLYYPYSSMAFFKRLADIINYEHWGNSFNPNDVLNGFSKRYSCRIDDDILFEIHSIEFFNSCCVIRKKPCHENVLGQRIISGCDETVTQDLKSLEGLSTSPHQSAIWSTISSPPDEDWEKLFPKYECLKNQVRQLEKEIEELNKYVSQLIDNISKLEDTIHNILTSTSWKLTYPLRFIKHFFLKSPGS